jgi:hypothetical protein
LSTCDCHLPTDPPLGVEWWRPDKDDDPGLCVKAVARAGEDPVLRRAVRRRDGSGWAEEGTMVNFYHDITPPMPWERTGMCWNDVPHPVVKCEPWPL